MDKDRPLPVVDSIAAQTLVDRYGMDRYVGLVGLHNALARVRDDFLHAITPQLDNFQARYADDCHEKELQHLRDHPDSNEPYEAPVLDLAGFGQSFVDAYCKQDTLPARAFAQIYGNQVNVGESTSTIGDTPITEQHLEFCGGLLRLDVSYQPPGDATYQTPHIDLSQLNSIKVTTFGNLNTCRRQHAGRSDPGLVRSATGHGDDAATT
jgi:hypothetical protein